MADDIQIRLVHVEFLRSGPPHNQLLSPLTQYLAISGDAGAGVVTLPYEHAEFERRLKELRYETGDPADRQEMLHTTGVDMGKILGSVPGVAGALMVDPHKLGMLVHLRLTLSASELALLPFELAKMPVSPTATTESWLSIQTRPPICVTRNIRTVSPEGVTWPERPRILFVAGDPADVPFADHRQVLVDAIQPFQYPVRDDATLSQDGAREQFGDLLTILVNPTLTDVFRECRDTRYTHVHIVTHGDLNENARDSYGLVLRGLDGAPEVVSGEQFASALTSVSEGLIHRPTAVTVSSCDSGNVGTVVIPGASFAHALHQSGIPLVVASQFPLSKEGSIPLAATLYQGLLWGANPLVLLQQVRAELHARYTASWHDWASLVVYEALPLALSDQLEKVRYLQARRAINSALERIDRAVLQSRDRTATHESLGTLEGALDAALERLPLGGQYCVECLGLRASSRKRLAQAAFSLSGPSTGADSTPWRDPYELLDQAWHDYDLAVRGLLVNEGRATQRVATLHWILVQFVSLAAILGRDVDEDRWITAKLSADLYRDHPLTEERAWAHGSLAELWLIRLAQADLSAEQRETFADRAIQHAQELAQIYPWGDEFPIKSTRRQFKRYLDWWGTSAFDQGLTTRGLRRASAWDGEHGVLQTAERLVAVLQRNAPAPPRPAPSGPKGSRLPQRSAKEPAAAKPARAVEAIAPAAVLQKKTEADTGRRKGTTRPNAKVFSIEMIPAGHGDSIWIEYGDGRKTHRLLADCGTQQTASELLRRVEALPEKDRFLELFVMSHIDSDHIGGALPFFKAVKRGLTFGDVWFNGWRHISGRLGARQGEMFSAAIQDFKLPWNDWRDGGAVVLDSDTPATCELPGGMRLTLLSPTPNELKKLAPAWMRELKRYGLEPGTRVDYSRFLKGTPSTSTDVDQLADATFSPDAGLPNGTSIAVLAEFNGASALLAADAHAPLLANSIRALLRARGVDRLKLDAFKVSHHASQYNVSTELIELLDCRRYLVSTNGEHFCHPDRQAIARIVKYGGANPELYFNYKSRYNDVWARPDLQEKYGYRAFYPEGDRVGQTVSLFAEPHR